MNKFKEIVDEANLIFNIEYISNAIDKNILF